MKIKSINCKYRKSCFQEKHRKNILQLLELKLLKKSLKGQGSAQRLPPISASTTSINCPISGGWNRTDAPTSTPAAARFSSSGCAFSLHSLAPRTAADLLLPEFSFILSFFFHLHPPQKEYRFTTYKNSQTKKNLLAAIKRQGIKLIIDKG